MAATKTPVWFDVPPDRALWRLPWNSRIYASSQNTGWWTGRQILLQNSMPGYRGFRQVRVGHHAGERWELGGLGRVGYELPSAFAIEYDLPVFYLRRDQLRDTLPVWNDAMLELGAPDFVTWPAFDAEGDDELRAYLTFLGQILFTDQEAQTALRVAADALVAADLAHSILELELGDLAYIPGAPDKGPLIAALGTHVRQNLDSPRVLVHWIEENWRLPASVSRVFASNFNRTDFWQLAPISPELFAQRAAITALSILLGAAWDGWVFSGLLDPDVQVSHGWATFFCPELPSLEVDARGGDFCVRIPEKRFVCSDKHTVFAHVYSFRDWDYEHWPVLPTTTEELFEYPGGWHEPEPSERAAGIEAYALRYGDQIAVVSPYYERLLDAVAARRPE